jgi:hypothetical protein
MKIKTYVWIENSDTGVALSLKKEVDWGEVVPVVGDEVAMMGCYPLEVESRAVDLEDEVPSLTVHMNFPLGPQTSRWVEVYDRWVASGWVGVEPESREGVLEFARDVEIERRGRI